MREEQTLTTTSDGAHASPKYYAQGNNTVQWGEERGKLSTGQTYCWWPACMDADGSNPTGDFIRNQEQDEQTQCPNFCVVSVDAQAGRDVVMNDNTFTIEGCGDVGCDGCKGSNMKFDVCGVCGGGGITGGQCACGMELDACGVCGGRGYGCLGCDGKPNSNMKPDICGVCGGPGIPEGSCNCNGDVEDACGVCGGSNTEEDCPAYSKEADDAREPGECPPEGGGGGSGGGSGGGGDGGSGGRSGGGRSEVSSPWRVPDRGDEPGQTGWRRSPEIRDSRRNRRLGTDPH